MAEKIWDTIFDCRKTPSAKELNNILTQDRLSSYKAIEGILEEQMEGLNCLAHPQSEAMSDEARLTSFIKTVNRLDHDLKQELKTLFNINE